ncbi:hypothetical protein N752_15515 [Desulforamulus aquiferis]|nr:hypothetical protein [Desulforamulus aquiferis]RYD04250.1 hypothetical protein N752_15515 [Desulforamulus aquiferis]
MGTATIGSRYQGTSLEGGVAYESTRKVTRIPEPKVDLSPREAWLRGRKKMAIEKCLGMISAETIAVYPPGIPVLCPGERITVSVLEYLREVREHSFHLQGPSDTSLKTLTVII